MKFSKHLEKKIYVKSSTLGEKLLQKLNSEVGQHPNIAEIRGKGLLIGIEIVEDKSNLKPFDESKKITSKVMQKGLEEGVFLYPGVLPISGYYLSGSCIYYRGSRN